MFGLDLIDAGLLPAMLVAVLAGVLSFLSPCVLPIVPPYLAYMGGVSVSDMKGQVRRAPVVLAVLMLLFPAAFSAGRRSQWAWLAATAGLASGFFLLRAWWPTDPRRRAPREQPGRSPAWMMPMAGRAGWRRGPAGPVPR